MYFDKINELYNRNQPMKITDQVWPESITPLVSIFCVTYNHGNYIRDALDSFLMQETSFPVEILIHDDASTDGTAEIIRDYSNKYPLLIKPILQSKNQYSLGKKPGAILRKFIKGSFIAPCEGDDCWLNKQKLELQVKIMAEHDDCVLVGGRCLVYNEEVKQERIQPHLSTHLDGKLKNAFQNDMWFHMSTRLWRKSYLDTFYSKVNLNYEQDLGQVLYLLSKVKSDEVSVYSVDDVVSKYRIHSGGVWSSIPDLKRLGINLKYFFYFRRFFCIQSKGHIDGLINGSIDELVKNKVVIRYKYLLLLLWPAIKSGYLMAWIRRKLNKS